MACISRALIIGGGIAGLSAAVALARAGVQCELVELADTPAGASIAFSGRVPEALDELGIYDALYAVSTPFGADTKAVTQRDSTGRVLSAGPQRPQWPGARTAIGIHRPVLIQTLEEAALGLGVKIFKGVTVRTTDEREDGVSVTLTDGRQADYDVIVGADGIGSRTRAQLFPDGPVPTYAGQFSLRWVLPGKPVEEEGWYIGPVGRIGFYHLPQGLVYIPAVVNVPERVRMSDEDVFALFTRLLDSYTAPAMVELRSRLTPDADLIGRPFEWILLPAPWHRGRTVLIGDAAHATTAHMGMGGGMAVEDAVVLGRCVAEAPTFEAAFDAFMARRFDRVSTVVETSVAMSRLEQEGAAPAEIMGVASVAFKTLGQPY